MYLVYVRYISSSAKVTMWTPVGLKIYLVLGYGRYVCAEKLGIIPTTLVDKKSEL